jgi:hypothetical protein
LGSVYFISKTTFLGSEDFWQKMSLKIIGGSVKVCFQKIGPGEIY